MCIRDRYRGKTGCSAISAANGVGKKTAERVILELKDKIGTFEDELPDSGQLYAEVSDERGEAVAGLMALGYTKNEAAAAVGKIKEDGLTLSLIHIW